jgi:hypothetical protein
MNALKECLLYRFELSVCDTHVISFLQPAGRVLPPYYPAKMTENSG